MKLTSKGLFPIILIVLLMVQLLSACSIIDGKDTSTNDQNGKSEYDTFITVDVFCSQANYQGLQAGWFAQVVKDRFNMSLNIIAPNVAGGGDTLYQTRAAAGNLGDIVMIGAENGRLTEAINANLLLDMSNYTYLMPQVMTYESAIKNIQEKINLDDGIYAIPSSVTSYDATEPSEATEPTFGPYLRWDLYTEIGAPRMTTLEDLLPVLKEMQTLYSETESGQKTYGFSLFKDWDDNLMMMGKQPACFYGYDEIGFLLSKADGSDVVSIIEPDSPYIRSLRLYYEANQMGLVDPDSPTQNWDTVWSKYADGAILFSPWPWLGQAAYNTVENLDAGKGFMMAAIDDMEIFSYGATPNGSDYVVAIGSQSQDPERMAAFINWLYSPEGILMSTSQTGSTSGPEGLTWEMVDGRPQLTEFGIRAMLETGAVMPEAWGGGRWEDGISQINFNTVLSKDINPETGFSYDFRYWDSYIEFVSTPIHKSWQTRMGSLSTFDYLNQSNQLIVAPGTNYLAPAENAQISTLRTQCKEVIVDYSWKMVFANSQEEFDAYLAKMRDTVMDLGYDAVLEFDYKTAKDLNAARDQARK